MSRLFFTFTLDPKDEYSRIYRLDRMVLEIVRHKESAIQSNIVTQFTGELASQFTLLASERVQHLLYFLTVIIFFIYLLLFDTIRHELYREAAFFHVSSVNLVVRALNILIAEKDLQNSATTKILM